MQPERRQFLQNKVYETKRAVFEMCVAAGMGHITSAFSCAEITVALYYEIMRIRPKEPDWENRDRFIMSKNHGSVMTYPILADLGYIDKAELGAFMKDGTRLGGHSKTAVPGVDFAGGSLGIGLGVGAGLAYAAKMDGRDFLTFVIIGDGECYEGSIWEAAMFAAHNRLDNLVVALDRNRLCCTDFTENILRLEPLDRKWEAFGWKTAQINGHNIAEVCGALSDAKSAASEGSSDNMPYIIIADTVKGNGIDFICDEPLYHGVVPKNDDIERARKKINEWDIVI